VSYIGEPTSELAGTHLGLDHPDDGERARGQAGLGATLLGQVIVEIE
jgi:hypothetical protein